MEGKADLIQKLESRLIGKLLLVLGGGRVIGWGGGGLSWLRLRLRLIGATIVVVKMVRVIPMQSKDRDVRRANRKMEGRRGVIEMKSRRWRRRRRRDRLKIRPGRRHELRSLRVQSAKRNVSRYRWIWWRWSSFVLGHFNSRFRLFGLGFGSVLCALSKRRWNWRGRRLLSRLPCGLRSTLFITFLFSFLYFLFILISDDE